MTLWASIYEAKLIMYRSSHPEVFFNSQRNTFARVSVLTNLLLVKSLVACYKRHFSTGVFKNRFFRTTPGNCF